MADQSESTILLTDQSQVADRGEASRRGAEAEQVPAADPGDRRSDQGARDPLQEGAEVQEEREQIQPQTEAQRGVG